MLKLGINYCDCSGLMSTCKNSDDVVGQQLCDHNDNPNNNNCIYLRKELNNHCDNPAAQQEARHGKTTELIKPLTEEDVFDVRNRNTYPKY